MIMTPIEYYFRILRSWFFGRYRLGYKVCEGIDNYSCCEVSDVKVYSIAEIMLSSLPTTLFFVEASYIAWGKFIQCP